jgi:hypothetical protein
VNRVCVVGQLNSASVAGQRLPTRRLLHGTPVYAADPIPVRNTAKTEPPKQEGASSPTRLMAAEFQTDGCPPGRLVTRLTWIHRFFLGFFCSFFIDVPLDIRCSPRDVIDWLPSEWSADHAHFAGSARGVVFPRDLSCRCAGSPA